MSTVVPLGVHPLRQAKADCGCTVVLVQGYLLDGSTGRFLNSGSQLVVTPCDREVEEEHVELARVAYREVIDDEALSRLPVVEALARRLSALVAGDA